MSRKLLFHPKWRPTQEAWGRMISELIFEMSEDELREWCEWEGTTFEASVAAADRAIEEAFQKAKIPYLRMVDG